MSQRRKKRRSSKQTVQSRFGSQPISKRSDAAADSHPKDAQEKDTAHGVPSRFSWKEKFLLAAVLLLIYATVATWGHFDFSNMMGYYDMLADAFNQGRLYIEARPDQIIIYDMIPYEGRYYLQWGPFPALLHLAGKWIGTGLSDRVASLLAGWLTALLFFAIILSLRRNYFPAVPKSVCTWFLFAFALATPAAFVSWRGTIYHESIVVAMLGVVLSFYAFLRYLQAPSPAWALLCGFGIAAALATRSSLGVYGIVLGCAFLAIQFFHGRKIVTAISHVAAYGAPILVSGLSLMAYNDARFGSPFEFGIQYLPSSKTEGFKIFDLRRVPENLQQYLLAPIEFEGDYPWLIHDGWEPLESTTRAEDMSSLLITSPFLLLGILSWPLLAGKENGGTWPRELRVFIITTAAASLLVFMVMMTFSASSRRYAHDFVAVWMIVVFTGTALQAGRPIAWRRWLAAGWAVVVVSGLLHAHLCFTRPEPADINVIRTLAAMSPYARTILPSGPQWDREEAIARNDLGTVYMRERKYRAALEQFEKAAQLMPNEPLIERNLALARKFARSQGRSSRRTGSRP